MKTKTILIDDSEVTVTKLPLKKLAILIGTLQNIPKLISLVEGKTGEELMQSLGMIIQECEPDAVKILSASTDIPPEEVETWGLVELIDAGLAVYEVNNLKALYERIKKVPARPPIQTELSENLTPSNGSIPQ